jgi:hypothetical protein
MVWMNSSILPNVFIESGDQRQQPNRQTCSLRISKQKYITEETENPSMIIGPLSEEEMSAFDELDLKNGDVESILREYATKRSLLAWEKQ